MSRLVMCDHVWRNCAKQSVMLIIVYNKNEIQVFGMNFTFISSCVAKNCIFHLWLCRS